MRNFALYPSKKLRIRTVFYSYGRRSRSLKKPDFLIFPQRFCFGNIHALDTLLYRFFRIGRAERLCAGKPFLSGSAERNIFALFDFIPHFLQAAQQFVKIFHLGNESIYRRFQLCFVACPLLFGGVFCIAFSLVLSRYDDG